MNHYNNLNAASGYCFGAGNFLGKLRYVLLPQIGLIINILGLLVTLAGYILWAIAAAMFSDDTQEKPKCPWQSLIRNYNIGSAVIGIIATIMCILFVVNPIFLAIGLSLYIPSQVFWLIGEFHKLQKIQEGTSYSKTGQIASIIYAASSLAFTVLCAASYIAVLIIAPSVLLASVFASPVGTLLIATITLGVIFLGFMALSYIQSDIKSNVSLGRENSYTDILTELNYSGNPEVALENDQEYTHIIEPDKTCKDTKPSSILRTLSRNTHDFINNADDQERTNCFNF